MSTAVICAIAFEPKQSSEVGLLLCLCEVAKRVGQSFVLNKDKIDPDLFKSGSIPRELLVFIDDSLDSIPPSGVIPAVNGMILDVI